MSSSVILVGIDGSQRSREALQWALAEARLRDCGVEAVTACSDGADPAAFTRADETLRQVIDEVLREEQEPLPVLSSEVVVGRPEEVLVHASRHADLLVVGSHSTQTIRHVALGSVSEYAARMASCPVVVIPAPAQPGSPSESAAVAAVAANASSPAS